MNGKSPSMISVRTAGLWPALVLAFLVLGCSRGSETTRKETSAADTAAYQAALRMEQPEARIDALRGFLESYPESALRPAAYRKLYDELQKKDEEGAHELLTLGLARETAPQVRATLLYKNYEHARDSHPEQMESAARRILDEDPADAGIFNAVAWDLVERGSHLDLAVDLARRGAEKAEEGASKAYILDTEGWALYKMGRYPEAVQVLEEAVRVYAEPDQELTGHLARAHAKGGDKNRALDLMVDLLTEQEDPEIRGFVEQLAGETGRALPALREEIRRRRMENASPAPDFTLKTLDGRSVSLSDFRGKVLLLNFWFPT